MKIFVICYAPLVGIVLLTGCASTSGPNRYQAELDKLGADCQARGGILQATGYQSAQPSRDYVCRITTGGSRIAD